MQLGDLKRALDDCTQSLKYGSIPDAFRKQQELVARLNPPTATGRQKRCTHAASPFATE